MADWLEDCATALVGPLLSIASLLDLQAIVVDGNLPKKLIDHLRTLSTRPVPEARLLPVLEQETVGRNAAAIGSATLPLRRSYGPDQAMLFGI